MVEHLGNVRRVGIFVHVKFNRLIKFACIDVVEEPDIQEKPGLEI